MAKIFPFLFLGGVLGGVAAGGVWLLTRMGRVEAAPPVPVAPRLLAETPTSWSEDRNALSPAWPAGYSRIILMGGNQNLRARIGGVLMVNNPSGVAPTVPFTVELPVLVGGAFLRSATHTNPGDAGIPRTGLAPWTSTDYTGAGASTNRVGPLVLAPGNALALAFVAAIDALTDPLVGAITMRAVLKDGSGGLLVDRTLSHKPWFFNGTQGVLAAVSARERRAAALR